MPTPFLAELAKERQVKSTVDLTSPQYPSELFEFWWSYISQGRVTFFLSF